MCKSEHSARHIEAGRVLAAASDPAVAFSPGCLPAGPDSTPEGQELRGTLVFSGLRPAGGEKAV
eukprot:5037676-Pyramimonas_sp.AAC.1